MVRAIGGDRETQLGSSVAANSRLRKRSAELQNLHPRLFAPRNGAHYPVQCSQRTRSAQLAWRRPQRYAT
jgi:hypothetical protein